MIHEHDSGKTKHVEHVQLYASTHFWCRLPRRGHAWQKGEAHGEESDGARKHAHPPNEGALVSAVLRLPPPLGSGRELQQRAQRVLVLPWARPAPLLRDVQWHLVLLPGVGAGAQCEHAT